MLAAVLLSLSCASDFPSATVTIETAHGRERGTILSRCPLTRDGNFNRLILLMQKPVAAAEIPAIPEVK